MTTDTTKTGTSDRVATDSGTTDLERMATKTWAVDVFIGEHGGETRAEARLSTGAGTTLRGSGAARLNPKDRDVPEIGDELAVSRALERLSLTLLEAVNEDLEGIGQRTSEIASLQRESVVRPRAGAGEGRRRLGGRTMVGMEAPLRPTPALAWAAQHAARRHEALELSHVVDDVSLAWGEPLADTVREAQSDLDRLCDDVRRKHPGMDVSATVLVGSDAALLSRAIGSDLVVVGRQGADVEDDVFVGTTAITVAQHAQAPVVAVPSAWEPGDDAAPVVVAIDGFDPHPAAIRFGFEEARTAGVPLEIVGAWEPPAYFYRPTASGHTAEEWAERVADGLDHAVAPFRHGYPDVAVAVRSPKGSPVAVVLDAADDAGLLVVGRPDHSRRRRLPLGSVSRRLLHRSPVPVAIVPSDWCQPR